MKKSDYKVCVLEIICYKEYTDGTLRDMENIGSNDGLYCCSLGSRDLTSKEFKDFKANGPD